MAKRRRRSSSKEPVPGNPRVVLLYSLSGLFTLVVGGLFLARPGPLVSQDPGSAVLAATEAAPSAAPFDEALQTVIPVRAGRWTSLKVQTLATAAEARSAHAHFCVIADPASGVQVVVGPNWLQQRFAADTGEVVIAVVGGEQVNAAVQEAVEGLVGRLRVRLALDARQVHRT